MADRDVEITHAVSDKLQHFLNRSQAKRVVVAYSGGLDSTVLLHLLKSLSADLNCAVSAVHINHQLHRDSDSWVAHCEKQAKHIKVAFQSITVQVPSNHPQGLEAAARVVRYRALQSMMKTDDLLLTAHHQHDQAETVLLNLLRGTGTSGLKAMSEYQALSKGALARPLLSIPRDDIHRYAREHNLHWLDDPSNEEIRHARNYLRHQIIPLVSDRWPMWHKTVARSAIHQGEANEVIDREALRYLHRCLLPDSHNLLLRIFINLPSSHQHLVLRTWCKLNDVPMPNRQQLVRIGEAIFTHINKHNGTGSGIIYTCADTGLGVYHGTLRVIKPIKRVLIPPIEWHSDDDCDIPQLNLKLHRSELMRQAPSLFNQTLSVDFRRGGERCGCRNHLGETFHKSLKKIFQEYQIPEWQRECIPLIYWQGKLRLIWGITACD